MILDSQDGSKSTPVGTTQIKMRALDLEEVRHLGPKNLIYVQDTGFTSQVLVPAHRKMKDDAYLGREVKPTVHVRSIFGSDFYVSAETGVFEQDDLGEEMPVIRSVGARVSSSIFILGVDPEEAEERLKNALRAEFGAGVVELWNMRSGPTKDLRWDVYQVKTGWVQKEGGRKKGRGQEGSFQVIARQLLRRGVRDGHERYFMGKAEAGWQIVADPHDPDISETEVL